MCTRLIEAHNLSLRSVSAAVDVYCVLRSLRRLCVDTVVYCTEATLRVQMQLSVYLGTNKHRKMSDYRLTSGSGFAGVEVE